MNMGVGHLEAGNEYDDPLRRVTAWSTGASMRTAAHSSS